MYGLSVRNFRILFFCVREFHSTGQKMGAICLLKQWELYQIWVDTGFWLEEYKAWE